METAYFENIRFELISELRKSKKEINIAVAWFTNEDLYNIILERLKNNIKVKLVIINDFINNGDYGLDFENFIKNGGELYYGNDENPMHHKFCTIDNSILFTGSYNWTYYAENKNKENVIKFTENQSIVETYNFQFNNLISNLIKVESSNKISLADYELKNYFAVKNYLALDLLYRWKETPNFNFLENAFKIHPVNKYISKEFLRISRDNTEIEKREIILKNQKKIIEKDTSSKVITKTSIGIKGIINGIPNSFAVIIPKGTNIPCELSRKFITIDDNQSQMTIETYKGENPIADQNNKLGKIIMNDLPLRKAGMTSITVTLKISTNLNLNVLAVSNDTGNQMEAVYYDYSIFNV